MAGKETSLRFTKTALTAIAPTDKRAWYRDAKTAGLALCVTPAGTKTFYVIRRVAGMGRSGNTEFIRLGAFTGGSDGLTVEQASSAAREKLRVLNAGESVRAASLTRKDEMTVGDIWAIWKSERAVGPNPDKPIKRSWKKDQRLYDCHLKDRAKRRVSEITAPVASKIFSGVTVASGPVEANHVKRLARAMWNHVIKHHNLNIRNPWTTLKDNYEAAREEWIRPEQMPALFKAVDSISNQNAADVVRLCLYTGARSGNVKAMRWDQLDLTAAAWTIGSAHHKNKRIHTIPLVPAAMEVLNRRTGLNPNWVFPSANGNSHISDIYAAWKDVLAIYAKASKMEAVPDVRIHDLRHTTASWLVGQGVSLPMVGKLLGHTTTITTQRYAHLENDPVRDVLNKITAAMGAKTVDTCDAQSDT
ncbi:MAG TPA: DUF4102 domain-containing protein [Pseudomonas xinjiangensis]|uniref:DUF4102 domain-containing protein n=2 Tax=root TaxID=1 RepID=A0A7V1FRA2_9GAMM|nr:DUF4102 domain-containing protein [Halopseudomonas xinjiangensis]HEC48157.1 DUF4102 domain-containing protein [Halopseudomonas xinjiangensis]